MIGKKLQRSTRSGMTLVEVAIGAALFVAFASTAFMVVETSARSYRTETVAAHLDSRAREAMDRVASYLLAADFASLTPPVMPPEGVTAVDFQRSLGFKNGAVAWGPTERLTLEPDPADADDGADNDGDGAVDEGRLVWIQDPGAADERRVVMCSQVSETLEGEQAGNGLDDNGNGLIDERGFCLEYMGTRLIVRLTLEDSDVRGSRIPCTIVRSTTPRNTPEEE